VPLTNNSQESENGNETSRRPVSQLSTRQNTNAFSKFSCGAEVVKATGWYPYVLRNASSQGAE
jgi:hypothetical protein